MSIHDREYMKKSREHDPEPSRSAADKLDTVFSDFLAKHPGFFRNLTICLILIIVVAVVIANFV